MFGGFAGLNRQAGVQVLLVLLLPFVSDRVAVITCPSLQLAQVVLE